MKQTVTLLLFLLLGNLLNAADNLKVNPALLQKKWNAQWITHPDISGQEQGVYLFKKEIVIPEHTESFVINISADNRYVLYVNGKVVARGPARGDLNRWLFETVDIAPNLKTGNNHIAAKVWNMAQLKPVAQMSYETGLIIQGNTERESAVNTNKSWRVTIDKAYSFYRIDHLKRYYASGPGERFDGKLHPWHWETEDANANWVAPKEGLAGASMKSWTGTGRTEGRYLFPRAIPMMEATQQSFAAVRRTEGIDNANALLKPNESLEIPANSTVKILLDHGHLTNAYPQLTYSKGDNSTIKITYAESLFITENGVPTFEKGNRNVIDDKVIWGNYDLIDVDGGENRLFEPLWWRCFRYVELEITTKNEPLVLQNFESEFTAYPLKLKADFKCDNPMLKEVFDVAWHTQRLCAGELFYDTPYYEQLQYVGDTRIQALITAYASGDTILWKDAITDFYDSRFPFGLMQSRYPSSQVQIIAPFSLVWITMVHDYMMYTNDIAFIRKMLPAIQDILIWFDERMQVNGMPGNVESWLFTDWVQGWHIGYPPLDKDGRNSAILGMQYVYTLQKAVQIFDYFELPGLKKQWAEKAVKTQKAIVDLCWDEQKNMLADTPDKTSFSQHVNIFAILTNTFDKAKQKELMLRILNDSTIAQSTYYFDFYKVAAMKEAGLGDLYVETLQPLKAMIDNGLTTLVEQPEPTRSDSHAWSSSPVFYYFSLICGIEPAAPGFNSVRIAPQMGELKWIEGAMPHRLGEIKVSLKRGENKKISGDVTLPTGLSGTFVWEGKELTLKSGVNKIDAK
jgi:alpha-L-rhamnosidase